MTNILTDASKAYAHAYDFHYAKHDLLDALSRYQALIAEYPSSDEATNARAQIDNIVKVVVPADQLLDAKIELVRTILLRAR